MFSSALRAASEASSLSLTPSRVTQIPVVAWKRRGAANTAAAKKSSRKNCRSRRPRRSASPLRSPKRSVARERISIAVPHASQSPCA